MMSEGIETLPVTFAYVEKSDFSQLLPWCNSAFQVGFSDVWRGNLVRRICVFVSLLKGTV